MTLMKLVRHIGNIVLMGVLIFFLMVTVSYTVVKC